MTNRDVEDMRNQLLKTKIQYQKIINSGQIKDTSKIENMKKILSKLDHQLESLDEVETGPIPT